MNADSLRWDCHYMVGGQEFSPLWVQLNRDDKRRLLIICGAGFDPRALAVVSEIFASGVCDAECRLIEFGSGSGLPRPEDLERAQTNRTKLGEFFRADSLKVVAISMRSAEGRSVGGIRISEAFRDPKNYEGFSDVLIDITALPAELYFPLIATMLEVWRHRDAESQGLGNLHVAVCHNPEVDSMILPQGGEKAGLMYGFPGTLSQASIGDPIRIWAPVLGENQSERLIRITESLGPNVVAPILPFPARNPRRGDDLLLEYWGLIFETWEVDPTDIIYADEENPFDVYAKLCLLSSNYTASLSPIGTAQMIVSSHSSKLHSLGVLLAAWEQKLGVAHVQPAGHIVNGSFGADHENGELFDVWLCGEPYVGT